MVGIYEVSKWGKINHKRSTQEKISARKLNIHVISDGITRLPILEGEISHIELPRNGSPLGLTIVGGADTPLRCVVVQEIFTDGLVAQDGRLQPGDQIIEVDGMDMTTATHQQVCDALRKSQPILRLGVYRERIEAYKSSPASLASSSSSSSDVPLKGQQSIDYYNGKMGDNYFTEHTNGRSHFEPPIKEHAIIISLERKSGKHLGLKLGVRRSDPGIFIAEIIPQAIADKDGRLQPHDRIISINGEDTRYVRLEYASNLIRESQDYISFIIGRPSASTSKERYNSLSQDSLFGCEDNELSLALGSSSSCSDRTSECSAVDEDSVNCTTSFNDSQTQYLSSEIPFPDDSLHEKQIKKLTLEEETAQTLYESTKTLQQDSYKQNKWEVTSSVYESTIIQPKYKQSVVNGLSQVFGWKREEPQQLHQKQVRLTKGRKEGLGMRIGGGLSSNEGDTPIYVANINIQGPAGKSRQIKKGDVVLSVNNNSLLGLTHSQAVSLLKATAELATVTLTLLEGPESCQGGSANFVPSWLYWQRLPRSLHISKSVVLHRPPGASLGFSIVGGNDPNRGPEPIHVLFVVSTSPAAVDGRLRCGDRLLAVDGQCLEAVSHTTAVSLLKQAGQRVALEVVSWMGTEL